MLPGALTPRLQEHLARLGARLPFAQAAEELACFSGVQVSKSHARAHAEHVGAVWEEIQTAQAAQLAQTSAPAPKGPPVQLLSVDGAMVPLVGGEWAEVKTLVLGEVEAAAVVDGRMEVHSRGLSYFSRLTNAETFGPLALVETHRRGTETARTVCAVNDGAEWIQRFVDYHREDAVRILDFAHAAGYVAQIADAWWPEQPAQQQSWLQPTLHELKHGCAARVVAQLRTLRDQAVAEGRSGHVCARLDDCLGYLEPRVPQMAYAQFQAAGYPIGSGSVESANKLVVEARLKGSGMHWARPSVNPMLALRTAICNDQWTEMWAQIEPQLRRDACARQAARRNQRRAQQALAAQGSAMLEPSMPAAVGVTVCERGTEPAAPVALTALPSTPFVAPLSTPGVMATECDTHCPPANSPKPTTETRPAHKPAANHPWRHAVYGHALFKRKPTRTSAKS